MRVERRDSCRLGGARVPPTSIRLLSSFPLLATSRNTCHTGTTGGYRISRVNIVPSPIYRVLTKNDGLSSATSPCHHDKGRFASSVKLRQNPRLEVNLTHHPDILGQTNVSDYNRDRAIISVTVDGTIFVIMYKLF